MRVPPTYSCGTSEFVVLYYTIHIVRLNISRLKRGVGIEMSGFGRSLIKSSRGRRSTVLVPACVNQLLSFKQSHITYHQSTQIIKWYLNHSHWLIHIHIFQYQSQDYLIRPPDAFTILHPDPSLPCNKSPPRRKRGKVKKKTRKYSNPIPFPFPYSQ